MSFNIYDLFSRRTAMYISTMAITVNIPSMFISLTLSLLLYSLLLKTSSPLDWAMESLRRMLCLAAPSFSMVKSILIKDPHFSSRYLSGCERLNALGAFIPVELVLKCRPLLAQVRESIARIIRWNFRNLKGLLHLGAAWDLSKNPHCLMTKIMGIKKAHDSIWLNLLRISRVMDLKGAGLVYAMTFQTTCSPELILNDTSIPPLNFKSQGLS